jgi:hypothetical protein
MSTAVDATLSALFIALFITVLVLFAYNTVIQLRSYIHEQQRKQMRLKLSTTSLNGTPSPIASPVASPSHVRTHSSAVERAVASMDPQGVSTSSPRGFEPLMTPTVNARADRASADPSVMELTAIHVQTPDTHGHISQCPGTHQCVSTNACTVSPATETLTTPVTTHTPTTPTSTNEHAFAAPNPGATPNLGSQMHADVQKHAHNTNLDTRQLQHPNQQI